MSPTRVVVVEDSRTQAAHICACLQSDGEVDVTTVARNVEEAVAAAANDQPDVITMDLEIPGGGGQVAIERIMQATPTPILLLSRLIDSPGSPAAIEALAAGAVDVLPKPERWEGSDADLLRRKVRLLSGVRVVRRRGRPATPAQPRFARSGSGPSVLAIAASTGGPSALATVMHDLGPVRLPVVIVQHIEAGFVAGLASWLARAGGHEVSVATDGERLRDGHVYVAPGGSHLRVLPGGRVRLDAHPESLHRPSADVLFSSVAEVAGPDAVAALLTGMGSDGAQGLLEVHRAGGRTVGQDEESSVIFGMPRAAQRLGAVQQMLPLEEIGGALGRLVAERVS